MQTKEIIIASARDLFTKYGYKKVSMDEIANKANVTKKTVYSYFKDKDSLFEYFIKEELERIKNNIEVEKKKNKNVVDFVSSCVYKIIENQKSNPLINNVFMESKEIESKTKKFLKVYEQGILDYIESLIEEEVRINNIRKCNAHLTAFIIYRTYLNVMFDYDREINAKEATNELMAILNNGLLNKEEK